MSTYSHSTSEGQSQPDATNTTDSKELANSSMFASVGTPMRRVGASLMRSGSIVFLIVIGAGVGIIVLAIVAKYPGLIQAGGKMSNGVVEGHITIDGRSHKPYEENKEDTGI